jgi:hypothetical protein
MKKSEKMPKAKRDNKRERLHPIVEELANSTPIGTHYYCGGEVYFIPQGNMGYRYCEGCKMTNVGDGIVHLIREAAFWK